MAQKVSFVDKIKILFLEVKVRELEGKLDDLKLEQVLHDSNVVGGVIEKLAQINTSIMNDSKEINSPRLELEWVEEDLNSKNYEIEYIEKGIKVTHEIIS